MSQDQGKRDRFASEGVIESAMGTFVPGSHVIFRGRDLHRDLNDMDWLELYVYGITGRRFEPRQVRLLHAIWTTTSYPDVRLWNNRVAALSGSARSTGNLGVAAALAVSEASIYGRGIDKRAITFLINTRKRVSSGDRLEDCIREELDAHRSVAGYGRPLINGDERNAHMIALADQLDLARGEHLQLALEIERMLLEGRWRMKMNYGGLAAALCADVGMTARDYYLFMFPAFLAGMQPCYIEAAENASGALYALPCTAYSVRRQASSLVGVIVGTGRLLEWRFNDDRKRYGALVEYAAGRASGFVLQRCCCTVG